MGTCENFSLPVRLLKTEGQGYEGGRQGGDKEAETVGMHFIFPPYCSPAKVSWIEGQNVETESALVAYSPEPYQSAAGSPEALNFCSSLTEPEMELIEDLGFRLAREKGERRRINNTCVNIISTGEGRLVTLHYSVLTGCLLLTGMG